MNPKTFYKLAPHPRDYIPKIFSDVRFARWMPAWLEKQYFAKGFMIKTELTKTEYGWRLAIKKYKSRRKDDEI